MTKFPESLEPGGDTAPNRITANRFAVTYVQEVPGYAPFHTLLHGVCVEIGDDVYEEACLLVGTYQRNDDGSIRRASLIDLATNDGRHILLSEDQHERLAALVPWEQTRAALADSTHPYRVAEAEVLAEVAGRLDEPDAIIVARP